MATTNVNTYDTFEEWRVKTNELGVKIADLDNNLFTVNVIASGNITASGNINALGNVVVTRDVRVSNNVFVTGTTDITGNVTASSNVVVTRDVRVSGNINALGNVVVTNDIYGLDDLFLSGNARITGNTVSTGNISTPANLIVSGFSNLSGNITTLGNVIVSKDVRVSNNVFIAGTTDITGNVTASSNVSVSRDIRVTGNTNALANLNVTNDVRATGNIFGSSNLIITGNVLAANVLANVHYGNFVTSKPAINLTFTGDVTGSGSVNLSNPNTNSLSIGLTVAADSVALGTDTTGDYVQSLSSADTANIIVNNGTGESSTPTINLAMTAVTPNTYGNANAIASFTVNRSGRLTAASNVLIDRNYGLTTNKPAINVLFTGNIVGSGNLLLNNENTNILTIINGNVGTDSVTLGTHTVGDYVKSMSSADTSNIIVNSGTGEGSTPSVNLAMTNVAPNTYGGENVISAFTVTKDGRLTAASNVTPNYLGLTAKPAVNLTFTGDVTGSGSMVLSGSSTNSLSIGLTVAADSVALGTDTTGNYVQSLVQGSGITLTGATPAEQGTPTIAANVRTVGTFVGDVSNANLLASILQVDGTGSLLDADLLDGQQGTYYLDWANQTGKPAINVLFTGNIVGSGNLVLTNSGTNILTITNGNVGTDSVTLGTHTVGDYVKTVSQGTGITVTGGTGEGSTPTVALAASGVGSAAVYGNANAVPQITVDTYGRITSAANLLIDRRYTTVTEKPSINLRFTGDATGNGNITISNSDKNELAISMVVSSVGSGTLPTTTVTPGTYGGNANVGYFTVDSTGRLTNAGNIKLHYKDGTLDASKPAINLTFTGDVTGSGGIVLSNAGTNSLSIALTNAANSIALGTDTTGNYTNRVEPGTMMTVSGTADEGNVITISHSDTSTLNGSQGGSGIASITVDDRGHVTAVTTATYLTSAPASSNVFSYFGAGANTISQTNATHSAINSTGFNFFAGKCAGNAITTGTNNVFLGESAGRNTTTGTDNFFAGLCAGFCNTAGCNIYIGCLTGYYNNAGYYNTFVGSKSGYKNTSGTCNSFFGSNAGGQNTTAIGNSFFGSSAGFTNSTGEFNVFMGYCAGALNTLGNRNVFVGDRAGKNNVSGNTNVAVGMYGGYCNISGRRNIYLGMCSGGNVTTGNDNIIFGCLTSCVGLTDNTSNVIIMATGGIQRFEIDSNLHNFYVGFCAGCSTITGTHNIIFGSCAGRLLNTGCQNNFLGQCAGWDNTTGGYNNFLGFRSGRLNSTGKYNNFIGRTAGCGNTTGSCNNFLGVHAGCLNTSGNLNIYLGHSSGGNVTTGHDNIILGRLSSCRGLTDDSSNVIVMATGGYRKLFIGSYISRNACLNGGFGFENIYIGGSTGCCTTTGNKNIYLGYLTGFGTTTGFCNTFVGDVSGCSTTTGTVNTFLGAGSGLCNTTGWRNLYLGFLSGGNVTTGNDNIIVGCLSSCFGLTNNTSNVIIMATGGVQQVKFDPTVPTGTNAGYNIFLGSDSGRCNVTGFNNIFIGVKAGCCNKFGNENIFIGHSAGLCSGIGFGSYSNATCYNIAIGNFAGYCMGFDSSYNVIVGHSAGRKGTTGFCNSTLVGHGSGFSLNTGSYNTFVGSYTGCSLTSSISNSIFGYRAGSQLTTGGCNSFFGDSAGYCSTTGCNNLFMGMCAGYCNTTGSNNLFFGKCSGVGTYGLGNNTTLSNKILMGNTSHTLACIQIAWTTVSDIRDKCIFGPVPHGKSFLSNINPITFSFKNRETNELKETKKRYGFSAQEVLAAEGDNPVIVGDENPDKLGLTHEYLIPILVNAVKELTQDIEMLKAEIAELKKSR